MSVEYKYDVAFSFFAGDEALANQLNDELKDRLATFLYSERQKELAGTDGEETFARVFGSEARVVVILYRAGWGDERWTRVESDAIRNRAHEEGYDFTLWVMLDKSSALPKWMPKRQLWYGLERFGVDGAVNAIEMRVQEVGGDTQPLTFEQKAARISRNVHDDAERKRFLDSDAGVSAAQSEIETLHAELTQRCEAVKASGMTAKIRTKHHSVGVTCHKLGLGVDWKLTYSNTLDKSSLEVTLWDGPPDVFGQTFFERPTRRRLRTFEFDRQHGVLGWREGHAAKFFPTPQLADECMTFLLEAAQEEQRKNRR